MDVFENMDLNMDRTKFKTELRSANIYKMIRGEQISGIKKHPSFYKKASCVSST